MMRKALLALIVLLLAIPCFSAHVPDEILVGFISQDKDIRASSVIELNRKFNALKTEKAVPNASPPKEKIKILDLGKTIKVPDLSLIYRISFPKGTDIKKVIAEYLKDPNVEYAQPNYILRAFLIPNDPGAIIIPNDPGFSNQWYLNKINAPIAWNISTGDASSVVAVIDTGVNYNHEDLLGKVILGRNYVFGQNPNNPLDDNGHGTHVAGVIAALTNNLKGMAGLNWNGKIYAIKVLDAYGFGNTSDAVSGIEEAVSKGVKIINLSLGDENYSPTLENAVNYAYANGSLVVAAAGNENTSIPTYPAAFTNAVAVAAVDEQDKRSIWNLYSASNYGSWVDVSAPGTNIYSLNLIYNNYAIKNGTSMATPQVSGLASLLFSRKPSWTPDQIRSRIENTCENIDPQNPGFEGKLGKGRINAARALGIPRAIITYPSSGSFFSKNVQIKGYANGEDFNKYLISVGSGTSPTNYTTLYTGYSPVVNGTIYDLDTTALPDGTQTIKLESISNEPYTVEAFVSVIIDNTPPKAEITSPANQATVEGALSIRGKAYDQNFDYYILEYSSDGSNYIKIANSSDQQILGELGTWNTAGLKGKYLIRLTVKDKAQNVSQNTVEIEATNLRAESVEIAGISKSSPNPFNPLTQGQTFFAYYLNGNTDIVIYLFNLNGELIWQKSFLAGFDGGKDKLNFAPWDGRDLYGQIVENGVYIFKITALTGGSRKILDSGKIIVIKS